MKKKKKNSYYVPVLKTIRKRSFYEKENVYFQGFWPQVLNISRAGVFRIVTFSEHLLPTACVYSMFLPLLPNLKMKTLNLKSKRKLVKLYIALQIMFISQIVRVKM